MGSASSTAPAYRETKPDLHILLESGPTYGLTGWQAAYLAGIIDGEGTIGIHGNDPSSPGSYHVVLIVDNTALRMRELDQPGYAAGLRRWKGGRRRRHDQ